MNDNVEELTENFNEMSNAYADRFKITFSGIIRRSDKPELNTKIDTLNVELKRLSPNKGHDFVDTNNIKFGHLNKGGLHENQNGQKRLAMNFIEKIKTSE